MPKFAQPHSLPVTALLTMLVALGPISTDLYLPALPTIQDDFATTVSTVQLTLSVYLVVFATFQLFFGPLSDRFGRRPTLIFGTAAYFLGSLACLLAPAMGWLIAARALQGLGACAGAVVARAVIRDVHGGVGAARVLSHMGTAMALAPAIGPILGGYLTVAFGWRSAFALLTLFSGIALFLLVWILPETNSRLDARAMSYGRILENFLRFLRDREYLGYLLTATATYSGLFAFISGSSFVFINVLGLPPDAYGYCFAAIVVGYMVGTQIGGRRVHRLGTLRTVRAGVMCAGIGGSSMLALILAGHYSVPGILLPMFVFMIGLGLVLPSAMAGCMAPFPESAGAASSLVGFTQYAVAAVVGLAVGHAFDQTARPMALAICIMGIGSAVAYQVFLARRDAASPESG